jgi:CRP/FNR family transcriptional regulator, nitrogen oxide reductase regulator
MKKLDESLLAGIPPFRQLERGQIRAILDQAMARRYDEGQAVFHAGDVAERFYLLLDGVIRVIRTTPGGEQIIAMHIAAGQLFGIAPAIGRDSYPATAMTAAESLTLSWPVRLWPEFVSQYPGFASETYAVVGSRMGELHNRLTEMATQAVEQRVANALLRMVNQTGRKVEGGIEITFPITRQNISEMTGTTLHTVSRLLSAWEKQGVVESRRRHIVVTNPHQLVVLSGSAGAR